MKQILAALPFLAIMSPVYASNLALGFCNSYTGHCQVVAPMDYANNQASPLAYCQKMAAQNNEAGGALYWACFQIQLPKWQEIK